MTTRIHKAGFYFVNGVMNDDGSGSKTTDVIQNIIQDAPNFRLDKTFVTFEYNDAAPAERVYIDLAIGVVGVIAAFYALHQEGKKKGDRASRVLGILGISAIALAMIDYACMQNDKNKIADRLANRVSAFLNDNRYNVANLVLHSQGADVGYRALASLQKYKNRVRVVTLGAMTTIPNMMCARAVNYKFKNDLVSNLLALPFEKGSEVLDNMSERNIIFLEKEGFLAHGVGDYLKEKQVQDTLKSLVS